MGNEVSGSSVVMPQQTVQPAAEPACSQVTSSSEAKTEVESSKMRVLTSDPTSPKQRVPLNSNEITSPRQKAVSTQGARSSARLRPGIPKRPGPNSKPTREIPEGLLMSTLLKRSGVSSASAQCICAEVFGTLDEETLSNTLKNRAQSKPAEVSESSRSSSSKTDKNLMKSQDLSEVTQEDELLHSPRTSARRLSHHKEEQNDKQRKGRCVKFSEGVSVMLVPSSAELPLSPRNQQQETTRGAVFQPESRSLVKNPDSSQPKAGTSNAKNSKPTLPPLEISCDAQTLPSHFLTLSPTSLALEKRRDHLASS
mmetsp:Transcript_8388/g.18022  ORF Transcript_8388/g.18022 Transcript_8388/m.18022 type:complete len:311 (+) Transcript_8388:135-1067(+)